MTHQTTIIIVIIALSLVTIASLVVAAWLTVEGKSAGEAWAMSAAGGGALASMLAKTKAEIEGKK